MPRVILSMDEFCREADRVLRDLPKALLARLENVVVDVRRRPSPRLLAKLQREGVDIPLGLFVGRSLVEQEYGELAPNQILLFKEPIEAICRSREEVIYEIRRTLLHELAHHFGYSEEDLEPFEQMPSPFDEPDA